MDAARGAGLLVESPDQYRVLSLTWLGREVLAGRQRDVPITPPAGRRPAKPVRSAGARLVKRSGPGRRRDADPDGARSWLVSGDTRRGPGDSAHGADACDRSEIALEQALRAWRTGVARQQGVPPYVVLHDRTLLAIAAARPHTVAALLNIPGMGPGKAEKYGAAILALCATVSP
jgi:superfamily II DNA helicase RecQ